MIKYDKIKLYPVDQAHLVINSGLGFLPHRHELLIHKNPPRLGVELRTTKKYHHTHAVVSTPLRFIYQSRFFATEVSTTVA